MSGSFEVFSFYLISATGLAAVLKQKHISSLLPLVMFGIVMSLWPSLASAKLQPHLVMVFFLVPLVFGNALVSSYKDLMTVGRAVLMMSVVPVLASTVVVGAIAHHWADIPWPLAFALGAVLSPTDTVALKGLLEKTALPRALVDIMEGEALLNDVSGLTMLHLSILAMLADTISPGAISFVFLHTLLIGAGVGLGSGYLVSRFLKFAHEPVSVNALILIAPFPVYALADHFEGSGILAIVCAALIIGSAQHRHLEFEGRIQSLVIWEHWVFILEATAFLMMGVELPRILMNFDIAGIIEIAQLSILIVTALILTRGLCVGFLMLYRHFILRKEVRIERGILASWFGVRGPVSTMAAFAIPAALPNGTPFADHEFVVATAFVVVSITLLLSLTIRPLAEFLELSDPEDQTHQELSIWAAVIKEAIKQIEWWTVDPGHADLDAFNRDLLQYSLIEYSYRLKRIEQLLESGPGSEVHHHDQPNIDFTGSESPIFLTDFMTSALALEITLFERETLLSLRRKFGEFDVRTFRKILLRIDLRLMFLRSVQSQVRFKVHPFQRTSTDLVQRSVDSE